MLQVLLIRVLFLYNAKSLETGLAGIRELADDMRSFADQLADPAELGDVWQGMMGSGR